MNKCVRCGLEFSRNVSFGVLIANVCSSCETVKEFGVPHFEEREFVPDIGYVEKSRLNEIDRRVAFPKNGKNFDDGYYVGRKGENGKIQERVPNY